MQTVIRSLPLMLAGTAGMTACQACRAGFTTDSSSSGVATHCVPCPALKAGTTGRCASCPAGTLLQHSFPSARVQVTYLQLDEWFWMCGREGGRANSRIGAAQAVQRTPRSSHASPAPQRMRLCVVSAHGALMERSPTNCVPCAQTVLLVLWGWVDAVHRVQREHARPLTVAHAILALSPRV